VSDDALGHEPRFLRASRWVTCVLCGRGIAPGFDLVIKGKFPRCAPCAVPRFDDRLFHVRRCACCGRWFWCDHRNRRYCTPACRKFAAACRRAARAGL
jgi:hypothetical protein